MDRHTIILGWYDTEDSVKKEIKDISDAIENGDRTYKLKYFSDVEFKGLLGNASRK